MNNTIKKLAQSINTDTSWEVQAGFHRSTLKNIKLPDLIVSYDDKFNKNSVELIYTEKVSVVLSTEEKDFLLNSITELLQNKRTQVLQYIEANL